MSTVNTPQNKIGNMGNPPQEKPGSQQDMGAAPGHEQARAPVVVPEDYQSAGKLKGKVALITGGDSGIGKSVATLFALEGANVAIVYDKSDDDAQDTKRRVEEAGQTCVLIKTDVREEANCANAVQKAVKELGGLNILVNNASEQHPQKSITDVSADQLKRTFETNLFGYFFMAKHAVPHLSEGDSIINTSSVTAYKGMPVLLDYASTKGAIVAFTRSLAESLKEKKIRVNSIAPGPVWTPLIPSTFPPDKVDEFGNSTIWERPAEPGEIATSYVFLASRDALFYSGQTFHPNGGTIVAG